MWAMLLPAAQSFAYADIKQELGIPIYVLWFVALASMAGTTFCAAVLLLVRPATGEIGQTE